VNTAHTGYGRRVPELAALVAFLFLATLLVYVILQVPVTGRSSRRVIDLRDRPATEDAEPAPLGAFTARLVLVRPGLRTITIDGITTDCGDLFALEVGRPEGWAREDADGQLNAWAHADAIVEVRLREDARGARAWLSSGDTAMDLPVAGLLGVQS